MGLMIKEDGYQINVDEIGHNPCITVLGRVGVDKAFSIDFDALKVLLIDRATVGTGELNHLLPEELDIVQAMGLINALVRLGAIEWNKNNAPVSPYTVRLCER